MVTGSGNLFGSGGSHTVSDSVIDQTASIGICPLAESCCHGDSDCNFQGR